jgi:hypothetical protein
LAEVAKNSTNINAASPRADVASLRISLDLTLSEQLINAAEASAIQPRVYDFQMSSTSAYWRTKKPRNHTSTSRELSTQDDYQHNEDLGQPLDVVSDHQHLIEELRDEFQRLLNSENPNEPPQHDGFLGLFIRVCLWQEELKTQTKRSWTQKSPYAGRVGHQKPIEVSKIGEGASFKVFKRYDRGSDFGRDSKLIVMKDSKVRFERDGRANDENLLFALISEIQILSHKPLHDHANIVKLLDVRWDHPSLQVEHLGPTIYLEYAQLGTLPDFCASNHPKSGDNVTRRHILLDICHGLQALHQCCITHGDIKPSNILLFPEGDRVLAKLSDFGCAVIRSSDQEGTSILKGLSPPWDAPEAGVEIPSELLHKTDIYSIGLVYWWFHLHGQDPFGLGEDETNIFNFNGDRATKLDAVKTLKRSEDLGSWMYQSITTINPYNDPHYDMEMEISLIAQATLMVDPLVRSLEDVIVVLEK